MCRFFIFYSHLQKSPTNLWNELFDYPCSFSKQAILPKYTPLLNNNPRNFHTHADGFGFWGKNKNDIFYYKIEKPIWQDQNLPHLLKNKKFNILFSHIRAIHPFSSSAITYNNCHPFIYKEWVFIHNGFIEFKELTKNKIIQNINPYLLNEIKGTTDTELLFYWWITFYNEKVWHYQNTGFLFSLWMKDLFKFCEEMGVVSGSFNFGLYNEIGDELVVSRALYSVNEFKNDPPSLYFEIKNDNIYIFSEPMCYHKKIFHLNLDNFNLDLEKKERTTFIHKKFINNKIFIFPKNNILYKKNNSKKLLFYEI